MQLQADVKGRDMYCTQCGQILKPGTLYCTHCGSRTREDSVGAAENPAPHASAVAADAVASSEDSRMDRQDIIIIVSLLAFAALLILIFAVTL